MSPEKTSARTALTIKRCGDRIESTAERARFVGMLTRANELSLQAKELRLAAWKRYRELTGYEKGDVAGLHGKYA